MQFINLIFCSIQVSLFSTIVDAYRPDFSYYWDNNTEHGSVSSYRNGSNGNITVITFQHEIKRGRAIQKLTVNVNVSLTETFANISDNVEVNITTCAEIRLRNPNSITKSLMKVLKVSLFSNQLDREFSCFVEFDIDTVKGNESRTDNFILRTVFVILDNQTKSNGTVTVLDPMMRVSHSDTYCDFENVCFLQNDEESGKFIIGDPSCSGCDTSLTSLVNTSNGHYGYLDQSSKQLISNIITGSTHRSVFDMTVWQKELDYTILVAAVLKDRSRVVLKKNRIDFSKTKRNEAISIGRIEEPFYLHLHLSYSQPMAVGDIVLHINKSDIPDRECGEFQCQSGQCIDQNKTCDFIQDCFDGDDESEVASCHERNYITNCDFESGMCQWTSDNVTATCSWQQQNVYQITMKEPYFGFEQRGNILFLNGSNCMKNTMINLTSLNFNQLEMDNSTCKIEFSYMIYNMFLRVMACTDDGCELIKRYEENRYREWRYTKLHIPYLNKRMHIKLGGEISSSSSPMFVGIDGAAINSSCFQSDSNNFVVTIADESDDSSVKILAIVLTCSLTAGIIIIIVIRKRKTGIKSTLTVLKLNTDQLLCGEHSSYSWVYSPVEDIPVDEYINSIPRQRITIQKLIAKGNFGEVYLGHLADVANRKQDIPVAVKTLPRLCSEQSKSDFFVEGVTLSKLKHPNVVRLLGISLEGSSMYLVCELMTGGDLRTHVRLLRGEIDDTTTEHLMNYIIDVANGCEYLEENGCIHRDLAARNCLLNQEPGGVVVKVGDFGMSRFTGRTNYYRKTGSAPIPVKWMSPEAFLEGMFTSKTDVWSFGILLWEVFTLGCVPYPGKSNEEVMEFVQNGGTPSKPDLCTNDLYELMFGCWNLSPPDRPNFTVLKTKLLGIKERGGYKNHLQNHYEVHLHSDGKLL